MSKATVNLTNWVLHVDEDEYYYLSGTADYHPILGKNAYVSQTSSLVDFIFEEDVLTYETRNTIYVCPLKYMSTWPYRGMGDEHRVKLTHRADASESILDKIIAATAKLSIQERKREYEELPEDLRRFYRDVCEISEDYSEDVLLKYIRNLQVQGQIEIEEMRKKEKKRLTELASKYEDCVYMEVSNVGCGNLLAYHLGDYTGVVEPDIHLGMFQDSVLYMKYARKDDPCSLDFRYFPKGLGTVMETYSWSDNIKYAVIKNETSYSLRFNRTEIPSGETMVFTPKDHRQGLISPDCHNGKSVFTKPKEKNADENE